MIRYDAKGRMHAVALSGGHDSSAMALELVERYPDIPFNFVCTPTGNELPAMFAHWRRLSEMLGSPIIPVMAGTLKATIEAEGMIPNHWARWCTRKLKIIPFREWVMEHGLMRHVISYVGLRADEEGRAGGAYEDIPGVETRHPLREWGWGEAEVQDKLRRAGVVVPDRTDCAWCFYQRLGEWYELWLYHNDLYLEGMAIEERTGHTFRTPGRDSWPVSMREMAERFAAGDIPERSLNRMARERQEIGSCRVCTL